MKSTVESGKYKIVESNSVFLDEPQSDMVVHLAIEGEQLGDIRVKFITLEDQKQGMQSEILNGTIILTCINFNDAFGTGTTKAFEIGSAQGKKVKLHLWSYLIGNGNVRKIEYSVYKEL